MLIKLTVILKFKLCVISVSEFILACKKKKKKRAQREVNLVAVLELLIISHIFKRDLLNAFNLF